jgi:hypothetical protein
MKKPVQRSEEPQPKNIQRADIAPATGYAMIVDGRFQTQFEEQAAAKKAATELLATFPMLQIEIYDASSKSRSFQHQGKFYEAGKYDRAGIQGLQRG